ncbi:MAG TPA: GNAT family N-acetyltransferase [Thermoplasmata archaeon]|nr:GNAT family N-acetyltransferase [Thermoplasmata archaeon]
MTTRARPRRPVRRPRPGSPAPVRGRFRVRSAGLGDLAVLVDHRRRMWQEIRDYRTTELDRHDASYRRWVRRGMAAGTFLARLVVDRDGTVVASGALWLMPEQPRPGPLGRREMPYLLSMYTEPAHRGRGAATRIVQDLVRWSRTHGYGRVLLHASAAGRSVYARLGFEPSSEMRLELRPIRRRRSYGARASPATSPRRAPGA